MVTGTSILQCFWTIPVQSEFRVRTINLIRMHLVFSDIILKPSVYFAIMFALKKIQLYNHHLTQLWTNYNTEISSFFSYNYESKALNMDGLKYQLPLKWQVVRYCLSVCPKMAERKERSVTTAEGRHSFLCQDDAMFRPQPQTRVDSDLQTGEREARHSHWHLELRRESGTWETNEGRERTMCIWKLRGFRYMVAIVLQ